MAWRRLVPGGIVFGGIAAVMVAAWLRPPAPARNTVPAPPRAGTSTASSDPMLADPADRAAFRAWFTFLAELQFFRESRDLPAEVADCAGLVRFAYREALRRHDGDWADQLRLPDVPPLGSIQALAYPFPGLGAGLFRTSAEGAWAEFADARTLARFNTFPMGRHVEAARPGDLLFFHQPAQRFPDHVMIWLGESRLRPDGCRYVVYHTGPEGSAPGEVRRPALEELRAHPSPQWRPVASNPHFLGVYRWNLLKED